MAIYISNVNGDWWKHEHNFPLFVLNTDDLTEEQLRDIFDEVGELEGDKFEHVIEEYGKQVTLNV
jgi:RNA recognition motif-containing protein